MLERIREITCYHRIQASEGYRNAAIHCRDKLLEYGVESQLLSYPTGYDKWHMTMHGFQEWGCKEAYCDLIGPDKKRIADYSEDNLSIIQKSFSCDYSDTPVDVVLLDRGPDSNMYDDIDIKGKIIFVRDNFNSYLDWAIQKRGAIGIITDYIAEVDGVRNRYDLLDIKKYNTFWWTKENTDLQPFGFVLTPREGDKLAELCRKSSKYPQVTCFVDSEFKNGFIENVSATIAGETSDEILITAHLCHPRSSANDNASGVSAAMEVLKTLQTLINNGELTKPKRTIRILLIPEYTGIYAYLDSLGEERHKIKAGINLDMVGGKQEAGYGPLTISGLPRSTPSFVMDLAVLILDELKKEIPGFSPGSLVPMFNSATAEFTSGSDNFILSDPSIGIPTPMLGQWPDKYYHTSGDTPQVISTHILSKSATIAAAYAYTLAKLSLEDLPFIFGKAYLRMQNELNELQNRVLNKEIPIINLIDGFKHYTEYYVKACEDYLRFFSEEEISKVKEMIDLEIARIRQSSDNMLKHFMDMNKENLSHSIKAVDDKYQYIPRRKYISPINQLSEFTAQNDNLVTALGDYIKGYRPLFSDSAYAELLIQYYIDGKSTINEIAKKVIIDCRDGDIEAVRQYILLLEKFDLVDIEEEEHEKNS